MLKPKIIHWRSGRLFVNGGMLFPACLANAALLDTSKSHLPTDGDRENVTCKNCLRLLTTTLKKRN